MIDKNQVIKSLKKSLNGTHRRKTQQCAPPPLQQKTTAPASSQKPKNKHINVQKTFFFFYHLKTQLVKLTGCMVPPAMMTALHSFSTCAKQTAGFNSRNLTLLSDNVPREMTPQPKMNTGIISKFVCAFFYFVENIPCLCITTLPSVLLLVKARKNVSSCIRGEADSAFSASTDSCWSGEATAHDGTNQFQNNNLKNLLFPLNKKIKKIKKKFHSRTTVENVETLKNLIVSEPESLTWSCAFVALQCFQVAV